MNNYFLDVGNDIAATAYAEANAYLDKRANASQPAASQRVASSGVMGSIGNVFAGMPSFTYNDNSWRWGNNQTTVIHSQAPSKTNKTKNDEAEEKKPETNWAALAVGTGILLATVAALGTVYNSCVKENKKLDEKMQWQINANECQESIVDKPNKTIDRDAFAQQSKVIALTRQMVEVQESQTSKINNYVYACFTAIAGAAALIGGSFVAESILIPVGMVAVIVAAAVAIFNYTSHLDDEKTLTAGYTKQRMLALEVNSNLGAVPVATATAYNAIPVAEVCVEAPAPSAPPAPNEKVA